MIALGGPKLKLFKLAFVQLYDDVSMIALGGPKLKPVLAVFNAVDHLFQ